MAVSQEGSLERLAKIFEENNPNPQRIFRAMSEEEFIEATEVIIEHAILRIEAGAKQYSGLDEMGLSQLLSDLLNMAGFNSTTEQNHRGHVDILVEHSFGRRWKYLGECKKYQGYRYHVKGCAQLLGYCTGRELRAFCMEFFTNFGMFEKMRKLREAFDKERPLSQKVNCGGHLIRGAFVTSHAHSSGNAIEILHLGCSVVYG